MSFPPPAILSEQAPGGNGNYVSHTHLPLPSSTATTSPQTSSHTQTENDTRSQWIYIPTLSLSPSPSQCRASTSRGHRERTTARYKHYGARPRRQTSTGRISSPHWQRRRASRPPAHADSQIPHRGVFHGSLPSPADNSSIQTQTSKHLHPTPA